MDEKQANYLNNLYNSALNGDHQSLQELSSIAAGRSDIKAAQNMIIDIESRNIQFNKKNITPVGSGVPRSAWPKSCQEQLDNGVKKHPVGGHPEHFNI